MKNQVKKYKMNTNINKESKYKQFAKEFHGLTAAELDESSLSRMTEHMMDHDCGIITAWRKNRPPCNKGKPYTLTENNSRNVALKLDLYEFRYGITAAEGAYTEVGSAVVDSSSPDETRGDVSEMRANRKFITKGNEEVFFVHDRNDRGDLRKNLFELGKKYDQDSVLFIPGISKRGETTERKDAELIFTNDCNAYERNPMGSTKKVGTFRNYGEALEYYAKMRNRAFKFAQMVSEEFDRKGLGGKQGMHLSSLKPWDEGRFPNQTPTEYWTTKYDNRRSSTLFTEMAAFPTKTNMLRSKMWILPDGSAVSLDGNWHYRWILANKERVAKFGLDTANLPDDEETVRIAALKKGFFRVNYEVRSGSLIIEGIQHKFNSKIKDAIFMIAMDNLNKLDRVKVTLFNDDVTAINRNRSAELFSIPTDEEKLEKIEDITSS